MAITMPKKGDRVSFSLVVSGINGDERTGLLVDAADIGYTTAILIDPGLNVKHNNLFPYFKNKVNGVEDPSVYNYIVLKLPNGSPEVIGVPWIQDSTFKFIEGVRRVVTIENWRQEWDAPMRTFYASLGAAINITEQSH